MYKIPEGNYQVQSSVTGSRTCVVQVRLGYRVAQCLCGRYSRCNKCFCLCWIQTVWHESQCQHGSRPNVSGSNGDTVTETQNNIFYVLLQYLYRASFIILYLDKPTHRYFTNYHTATCFDTIVSSQECTYRPARQQHQHTDCIYSQHTE